MKNNKKTLLFCIMVLFFWMALYTYPPQLSVYAGVLGASATLTGTILSSYGFVQMLLRVPLGLLSDKIRKRKIFVIIGGVFTLIAAFGMYLAKTPAMLLVFRGVSGISASAWVTFTVLYSSYFENEEVPKQMSKMMAFNNTGVLVGMILGGILSNVFGVRSSFLLAMIPGVISIILATQIVENKPTNVQEITGKELLSVATNKTLLSVSFLALLGQIVNQGATNGFVPKFAAEIGANSVILGFLSGAFTLGGIIGAFLNSSFLVKKVGNYVVILSGAFIYGVVTILLPILSKNIPVLLSMQLLAGIGNGISFPLLMGLSVAGIDQNKRGLAMGMFQSIYALGMFTGPILTGILADNITVGQSISIVGCVAILEVLIGFFILRQKKNKKTAH